MELQEMTPMERMIQWIESGCSTDGERWEEWKALMIESEIMYARHIASTEVINYITSKQN